MKILQNASSHILAVSTSLIVVFSGHATAVADPSPDAQAAIEAVDTATAVAEKGSIPSSYSQESGTVPAEISLPAAGSTETKIVDEELGTLSISAHEGDVTTRDGVSVIQGNQTTVAQERDNGSVQYSAVLNEDGKTQQTYTLSGDFDFTLEETPSEAIEIVAVGENHPSGSPRIVYGTIEKPWAIDADGNHLPTSYSIEGKTITQRVDTTGATYPVVADPRVTFGRGVYVNMTGAELNALASSSGIILGGSGVVACSVVEKMKIPSWPKLLLGALCSAVGTKIATEIVKESLKPGRYRFTQCYQMRYPSDNRGFVAVGAENCK